MDMIQSCRRARSTVPSFLLGAGCAALLVLSFAGASLALSGGGMETRKQGLNELRLDRMSPPTLTLGGLA
jgi:hypothetical protein